jgi:hypothetical protein
MSVVLTNTSTPVSIWLPPHILSLGEIELFRPLVDHLGNLDNAVAADAELANLGEKYEVSYIETD